MGTCDLCDGTGYVEIEGVSPSGWPLVDTCPRCSGKRSLDTDADEAWHEARRALWASYRVRLRRYADLLDQGADPVVARRFSGVVYVDPRTLEELRR